MAIGKRNRSILAVVCIEPDVAVERLQKASAMACMGQLSVGEKTARGMEHKLPGLCTKQA